MGNVQADAWRRAQTCDEVLQWFAVDTALLRAYREIGMDLVRGFQWVDAALARG
ncbi:MAG: hypothetical protein NZ699_12230 [Roseiflexus sp.]|nr:hypothetical protein [Roseiflexus sp.]MDW8145167.1 hypothetical protein [Roseiflexaceae bacterium]